MHKVYIALGANLGQKMITLRSAFEALKNLPETTNYRMSKIYETKPEHNEGPDFLNAVVSAETDLEPQRLLEYLLSLEHEFGRRKHEDRSRELDLDLLAYDSEVMEEDSPALILPHPRMHTRWFVLKPMCDLDPTWTHPLFDMTAEELLKEADNEGTEYDGNI